MATVKTENFYSREVEPLFRQVKGPVDSFAIRNDKELLGMATETAEIPEGAFRDCAVFGDEPAADEEKRIRYEAKRARDIWAILHEETEPSLDDRFAELYLRQTMARAVLVESARKLNRERADGSLTPRHERLYSEALDAAQTELFPRPDGEVAAYAMRKVIQGAKEGQGETLLAEYPFLAVQHEELAEETLAPEKRAEWHRMLHEKYDPVFEEVKMEIGDGLSNETLPQAVRFFMEKFGLPMRTDEAEGWECVEGDSAGFRVDPGTLRVICGRRKKEITWPAFEKLMIHEIGIHAARAENGRQLGHAAAQNGLPGYQEFEEGLGLLMEKLWADEPLDTIGRDHYRYLAVCYSDGMLDGTRHDETETLEFVSRIAAAQKPGGLQNAAVLEATRQTGFEHAKRGFRGMPEGKTMYSNLAYLAGKLKAIGFIGQSEAPAAETLEYLQRAKFNPTDETHVALILEAERYHDEL